MASYHGFASPFRWHVAETVRKRRLDLVELLLEHGVEIKSVPFTDVLLTWEPALIQFFLDNGADVVTNS